MSFPQSIKRSGGSVGLVSSVLAVTALSISIGGASHEMVGFISALPSHTLAVDCGPSAAGEFAMVGLAFAILGCVLTLACWRHLPRIHAITSLAIAFAALLALLNLPFLLSLLFEFQLYLLRR